MVEEAAGLRGATVLCNDPDGSGFSSGYPPVTAKTRPMQRAGKSAVMTRGGASPSGRHGLHHEPSPEPTALAERNDE
jgi:hypothetical protein